MTNVHSHSFSHLPVNSSSLQMTLLSDENEHNRSFNTKQTVIEYTNRSAFHPIVKPLQFHQQVPPIRTRIPLKLSRPIFNRTQQQQLVPYSQSNYKPVSFIPKQSSSNLKSLIPIVMINNHFHCLLQIISLL